MDYTFSYMIANTALVLVWVSFYFARVDLRREMLTMSGIFGVMGLFVQPIYLHDWWRPLTMMGTSVGIEDFIFGATVGGIAAVAYEVMYRKQFRRRSVTKRESTLDLRAIQI